MKSLKSRVAYLRVYLCVLWLCVACVVARAEAPANVAEEILSSTGVQGGLVVHVGCGDGRLTAALRASDAYLVHGLDTDPAAVEKTRELVQSRGLTDGVAVKQWDGGRLPYGDGLVNLIVVGPGEKLATKELMRVLAPHGVACVREDGGWTKQVKPWPEEIDEWTHFMHGPDGNMVANDTAVNSPYHLQWIGEPIHAKTHAHLSSINNMVSAGGRLFYVADMGQLGLPYSLPPHWFLVACDAFSGKVLWEREMGTWQPYKVPGRLLFPTDLYRRLVASKDRVYATLDIFGPVVALEAATGRTVRTYEGTELAREIVHSEGVLYVVTGTKSPEKVNRRAMASWIRQEPRRLLAFDAETGRVLWEKDDADTESLIEMSLAVNGGRVYFQNTESLLCVDAESGETVWSAPRPSSYPRPAWAGPTLVAQGDVVLSADRALPPRLGQLKPEEEIPENLSKKGKVRSATVVAFSADTGKKLWETPCSEGHYSPVDVFVVDGKVFIGEKHLRKARDYCTVRDLYTGEVVKTFESSDEGWVDFHHHRCYRDKATEKYVLAGRTGVEFMDMETGKVQPHRWIRGICRYGVLPCNGLLYLPPDQCGCYIQSKLTGFHVLAPARHGKGMKGEWTWDRKNRLQKGPAYTWAQKQDFSMSPKEDQWPTYRHDNLRSGHAKQSLPAQGLKRAWTKKLGGRLTQPVVADGRLFVASVDRRTLYALDADNGETLWKFSTGGRLDSPPTLIGSMAVFGCRDGNVYALRARDGQLVWRFRAAPRDEWLYAEGQMESVWPVHGSVLAEDGTICFAAGRNSYVDGGVFVYRLDVRTGKPLLEKRFCSRDPETGARVNLFPPYEAELLPDRELPGVLPDVPSSDGENIWMRSVTFDQSLDIKEEYPPHLFCSMGFLDQSWWELTYWIYGRHFFSGRKGVNYAKAVSPSGRIMVFDDSRTYGYKDETWTGTYGCQPGLFSTRRWPPNLVEIDLPKYRKGAYKNARHTTVKADWRRDVPLLPNAMVLCGDTLFVAGPRGFDQEEATSHLDTTKIYSRPVPPAMRQGLARWKGEDPGCLAAVDKATGETLARYEFRQSVPIFDGMIAAGRSLYFSLQDGSVTCMTHRQ